MSLLTPPVPPVPKTLEDLRRYVEALFRSFREDMTIVENTATDDHGSLSGLTDDDHTDYHNDTRGDARYIKIDGTTAFTGVVGGITPTAVAHLTRKDYVDGLDTAALAKIIVGDGTAARVLRCSNIKVENGTNASTLKCTVTSLWNGDAIAATDNVSKGATTGSFTLDAGGQDLTVEAAGLSGNVQMVVGVLRINAITAYRIPDVRVSSNDIVISLRNSSAVQQDMTTDVDTGQFQLVLLYITDA